MRPLPGPEVPDPHGQAALILVESLIHVLVEKGVLTRREALDAVETALDVEAEMADAAEPPETAAALSLLGRIGLSIERLTPPHGDGGDGDGQCMGMGGDGDGDGRGPG